jgi:hypothetical protein
MNTDEEKEQAEEQIPSDQAEETLPVQSSDEPEVEQTQQQEVPEEDDNPIIWSASEFVHGEKNGLWYVLFVVVVLGLIALDVFILKSYTFSALVIVMAIALIVYSRRPPRVIQYSLSNSHGLYVGQKLYGFSDFKAFGVIKDGEHH